MNQQVTQAYRFALDLTPSQERDLRRHAGAARLAYNWGLAQVKANLSQRTAERSYGIADQELTPSVNWSLYGLRKAWNQTKNEVAPWWAECSKEAYNTGLDQLARALKNWSDSRTGTRKGKRVGFPRFKPKRKATPRCGSPPAPSTSRRTAHTSPCPGWARSRPTSPFASFTCQADRHDPAPGQPCTVVGVDVGIKALAVLSDGTTVDNPRRHTTALRTLRRLSRTVSRRHGPDRRTGQVASNRWCKANAARNLAALVKRHVAGSGPETQNGRGADRETGHVPAGGCEASTPHRAPPRARRGLSPGNGRIIESH